MANYRLRIGFPTSNLMVVVSGSYLLTGQPVNLVFSQVTSANLSWTPPTQNEAGFSMTPSSHIVYASQNSDDWAGGISQDTSSASGFYVWTNASFVEGTTWYYWVRAYDINNSYSLPIYLGSKSF